MPAQVLLVTIDRVKLESRVKKYLKICIEKSTAYMDPVEEEADWSMSVLRILSWHSVPTSMWRTGRLGGWELLSANCALFASL